MTKDSFCSVNHWLNCDLVNTSRYAELFSIPVSGLSLLFYLYLFMASVLCLCSHKNKKGHLTFYFLMTLVGLIFSFAMAYLSSFVLKIMCPLCVGLYVVILLVTFFFPNTLGLSWKEVPSFMMNYFSGSLDFKPKFFSHLLIVSIYFLAGSLVLLASNRSRALETKSHQPIAATQAQQQEMSLEAKIESFVTQHFNQPTLSIDPGQRPAWGNSQAKVKIVEFSDFQCPFCQRAALFLKSNLKPFENDIALYFVHYPLDQSCNPNMHRPLHAHACAAARGALCASQKGLFWPYHDFIFQNQNKISPEFIKEAGKQVGLDSTWFAQCLESEEMKTRLKQDLDLATPLEVRGTPSVFVNGRRLNSWNERLIFQAIIQEEIQKSP